MSDFRLFTPAKASKKQLANLLRQFSYLIRARLTANDAIKMLSNQIEDKVFSKMMADVHFEMLKGRALSECLNDQKILSPLVPRMIMVGEKTGNLHSVLHSLSNLYEKEAEMENNIKNAFIYPVIVIVTMLIAVFVAIVYIVPQFTDLFTLFGGDLPLPTRILIALSDYVNHNLLGMYIVLFLVVAVTAIFFKLRIGKIFLDKMVLSVPVLRKYVMYKQNAQFAMTLAVCLQSGMVPASALSTAEIVLTNSILKNDIHECIYSVSKGRLLSDALSEKAHVLPMLTNMARLGENSGDLYSAINDASIVLYEEFLRVSKDALKLLEPMLTIIVGILVAFVMMAVVLPTLNMSTLI